MSSTDSTIETSSIPRQPGAPPSGLTSTFRPKRITSRYPPPDRANRGLTPTAGSWWSGRVFPVEQLLPLLVLALGGAMLAGPFLALVRPRAEVREGELERPPLGRSLAFMAIGLVGVVWAVATLVAS